MLRPKKSEEDKIITRINRIHTRIDKYISKKFSNLEMEILDEINSIRKESEVNIKQIQENSQKYLEEWKKKYQKNYDIDTKDYIYLLEKQNLESYYEKQRLKKILQDNNLTW